MDAVPRATLLLATLMGIYCFEVEDALHQHKAITETAVIGTPEIGCLKISQDG